MYFSMDFFPRNAILDYLERIVFLFLYFSQKKQAVANTATAILFYILITKNLQFIPRLKPWAFLQTLCKQRADFTSTFLYILINCYHILQRNFFKRKNEFNRFKNTVVSKYLL